MDQVLAFPRMSYQRLVAAFEPVKTHSEKVSNNHYKIKKLKISNRSMHRATNSSKIKPQNYHNREKDSYFHPIARRGNATNQSKERQRQTRNSKPRMRLLRAFLQEDALFSKGTLKEYLLNELSLHFYKSSTKNIIIKYQ